MDERTFQDLLATARDIDDEQLAAECEFVLLAAGRLGLRAGEISHLREDWIDWRKSQIRIPMYDPCDKGRDRQRCGYCHKRAHDRAELDEDISFEEALEERWNPKTKHSARVVPFDWEEDTADGVERFFFQNDRYPHSRVSVNRRVGTIVDEADLPPDTTVYPHALRATAATYHAGRGLEPFPLKALMGWSKVDVAQKYVRLSGTQTHRALHDVHGD